MIKPPSVQADYSLIFSGDPALDLPEDVDARELALKNARETGNWPLKEGQVATVFQLAPLTRQQFGWAMGENAHSTELGRPLHGIEFEDLILRLALRRVDNLGKHNVTRKRHPSGQWLAEPEIINVLHECAGVDCISELASHVIERATTTLRPL